MHVLWEPVISVCVCVCASKELRFPIVTMSNKVLIDIFYIVTPPKIYLAHPLPYNIYIYKIYIYMIEE